METPGQERGARGGPRASAAQRRKPAPAPDFAQAVGPAPYRPRPPAGRRFPPGPGGTQRSPPVLTQAQLGREQMAAQTVGGRVRQGSGASGQGLTFGKRQTRSGRGCWGRSCGGYPGDCYLCRKEGGSSGWAGGNPIRLPDPQSGCKQQLFPL